MDSSRPRAARRKSGPIHAIAFFFLFLGLSALLVGCVTKPKIQNVMLSYTVVKKTVTQNLPQGLREESLNGRALTSGYFNPKNLEDDATERSERAYAKVVINGSSRPYNLEVTVYREKKLKNGGYQELGEDAKLTRELVARLKEALSDRREDRNIIDDFRAF